MSHSSEAPDAGAGSISVMLVEDDERVRSRFGRQIAAAQGLALACAVSSAGEALDWLAEHPVNVLLVDLGLPDRSGIEVIQACTRLQPACEIMVITMFGDEGTMMQAFTAGASGYLLKDGSEEDLAAHIHNLRNGGAPMSPIIARQLLRRLAPPTASGEARAADGVVPLSPKESEVLGLVARGFSYPEVGRLLGVSVNTVHTHARNIYGKLNVSSKTEAVYEARQLGWIKG
ncbi:response regulator transcription factor [Pseudorhodoferax sp.]|uniref:response regulator transcription factor n=1 Tax=Pseudorhodoferax sp. TaxID=1993553 RepID=UPI002DD69702|nr:response regulator transcription factor [Pseudorhodoferax sp.]